MKQFSAKRNVQILANLLEQYEINHFIISPGSRNAPLSIHLSETVAFSCYSIVDERSACFVALGMAKSLGKPVAVVCTSGSAAANYYPAVTEAFYSNVPLLLLTADRPQDFVDLFDGQTIRQKNIFAQHSYGDFELTDEVSHQADDQNTNTVKKAIETCLEKQGPVHINIPLAEPLYELVSEIPVLPRVEKTVHTHKYELPSNLIAEWNLSKRIMILVGTRDYSDELQMQLSQLVKNHSAVVLTEANSNLNNEKFFEHIDRYIYSFGEEDFFTYKPDLLITVGQNVVSKKIKQFLRKAKPIHHWHVDPFWHPDTFFVLSEAVKTTPEIFFAKLLPAIKLDPHPYYNLWDVLREKKDLKHQEFAQFVGFSDFYLFKTLSDLIPENYRVHISNSSAIRYAQLFQFNKYRIYCNRGTSGIDGSTSTAMGYAMADLSPVLLVTGELSFFYDINGLWNPYIPPYTRIIVFNNGGGDIFRIIPGPSHASNALDEFIATTHHKNCELLAKNFGFEYIKVDDDAATERVLSNFFAPGKKPKLLEVDTASVENSVVLKSYFEFLK